MERDMNRIVPESFRGCAQVRAEGRTVFSLCRGPRDLPNGIPNNLQTRFPTASAGKAFVATAVLQLVDQGRLSLDDRLSAVLALEADGIGSATIRQLLNHTSGVPDYFDESLMNDYAQLWTDLPNYRIRRNSDLFPLFMHKPMMYAPGERFQYNNSGYVLLAAVLEQRTGQPFDELLQRAVFEPAGMSRTGYYELDRLPENCANAYIWDEKRQEYYSNIFSVDGKGTGAGGAYTTAEDVGRFWDALLGGLVSPEMLREMTAVQAQDGDGAAYGYGLWLKRRKGALLPYFTGSDPGVSFVSICCPEHRMDVTVVSNFGDNVWTVRDALLDEYLR